MSEIRSICVYCGSSRGRSDIYMNAGQKLGRSIAEAGLGLIYGGGTNGIMGAVAAGARAAGGHVAGIIPHFLVNREASESSLDGIDNVVITEDMHTRKHRMFEESDAFVALPGGIGTVEEIIEIMTWAQLGRHRKPIVFANVAGFWEPMLALLDHMNEEGFIHTSHLVRPLVVDAVEQIVPNILDAARAAALPVSGDEKVIGKL